jgi:hypothetical protein
LRRIDDRPHIDPLPRDVDAMGGVFVAPLDHRFVDLFSVRPEERDQLPDLLLAASTLGRPPLGDHRSFPKSAPSKEVGGLVWELVTGVEGHIDVE